MAVSAGVHSVGVQDRDLFDRLYQDYGPRLQRAIRGFMGSDHLVDDVVQETFIRYYQTGYSDFAERDPWPWLLTVSRRVAIDMHRRRAVRREWASEHERLEQSSVRLSQLLGDPESVVIPSRQAENVAEALRHLDPRHRRILLSKHVQGFKYAEIADAEGMSLEALKSAMARARRSFKASYLEVVRSRGFEAVFGPLLFPLARRLRGMRDRFMSSPWVQNVANAPMSASVAADSFAAMVVIGVGVMGSVAAGAQPMTVEPPVPVESVAPVSSVVHDSWAPRPPAVAPDRPGGDAVAGAPAVPGAGTGAVGDGSLGAPADDSLGHGDDEELPPPDDGRPVDTHFQMDSDDVIPVENPPADGGGSAGADDDWVGTIQEIRFDDDMDGEDDGGVGNSAALDCAPSEYQGTVTKTACSAVGTAYEASDPESDPPGSLPDPTD